MRVASWTILGAIAMWSVLPGCPHPRQPAGPRGSSAKVSGARIESETALPSAPEDLLRFARKHAAARDDFASLVQAVAAYRKLLAQGDPDEKLWTEAVRTACRAAEVADRDEDVGRYAALTIQWAKTAAEKFPKSAVFPYRWAVALGLKLRTSVKGALDKVKLVEKLATRAKELDERLDFAGPLRILGALYVRAPEVGSIGDPDKGVELLERAVSLFPNYAPNRYFLGEGYFKQEEYEKAKKEFEFVLRAPVGPGYTQRDAKWFRRHARNYLKKIAVKQSSGPEV